MPSVIGAGTTGIGTGMASGAGDDQSLEDFKTFNKGLYCEIVIFLGTVVGEGGVPVTGSKTDKYGVLVFLPV